MGNTELSEESCALVELSLEESCHFVMLGKFEAEDGVVRVVEGRSSS